MFAFVVCSIMMMTMTLLVAQPALCDDDQQQQHDHSMMEPGEMGKVHFATSCSPAAQEHFDHAVAMLHSFGYEDAANAFAEVAGIDPACAMAWWGVAMTHYHPVWGPPTGEDLQKGREAVEKARHTGKPTDREQAFIAALEAFYGAPPSAEVPARAAAYTKAMAQVAQKYPDDDEAAIFYALALRGTAPQNDRSYAVQKKSADILNRILKKEPNHPGIAHYLIHDYDYPGLAELALPAARIYASVAPASPHALHMPSHIFTRLGLWDESIQSNIASRDAAIARVRRLHPGCGSFDQLHAMDYLAYAYLQTGHDAEAGEVVKQMKAITKVDRDELAAGYALAAIPARYAVERGRWDEAAALRPGPDWFPWKQFPWAEAITWYARGLGAARTGDAAAARKDYERLNALRQAALTLKDSYWAGQIDIQQTAVGAWIAYAEKKPLEALQKMSQAAEMEDRTDKSPVTPGAIMPARELLADMLMEYGQTDEAADEYEKSLNAAPNRLHALLGAGRAAEASGRAEKARSWYAMALQSCGKSSSSCSSERDDVLHAKNALATVKK